MKKNTLIIITLIAVLLIGLFVLSGCVKKEENKGNEVEKKNETVEATPQVVDDSLVKINGLDFHLDKEATFKDMNYLTVSAFKEASFGRYVQYNYYLEDNSNLLYFRIFYYNGKSEDEIIQDLGYDKDKLYSEEGKTDNIEYKFFDTKDDGGSMHLYFVNKDDATYVLNFASKYDIKDFEDKVVKTIKF